MNNFKLLAIRPRKGCHASLLKNLSSDQLYSFYSSYRFYNEQNDEVKKGEGEIAYYTYHSKVPDNLYEITHDGKQPIRFNLSAIAGKNGSGKSTLIELLFAVVFVVSQRANILTPTESDLISNLKNLDKQLRINQNRKDELGKNKSGYISAYNKALGNDPSLIPFTEVEMAVLEQKRREDMLLEESNNLKAEISRHKSILEEYALMSYRTKADVIFQVDDLVYILKTSSEDGTFIELLGEGHPEKESKKQLLTVDNIAELFCYSIAVNYSHYGLNSQNLGHWINLLFHKNDGYQTPLVITPMRTSGNFDINSEIGFAKARLLNNVILQWNRNPNEEVELVENQMITEVVFKLNKSKVNKIHDYLSLVDGKLDGDERAKAMIKDYFTIALPKYKDFEFRDFPLRGKLLNYIVSKIDKISEYYPGFSPAYMYNENPPKERNDELLQRIFKDTTHVTYKLHQAVHFLGFCILAEDTQEFKIQPSDLKGNKKIEFSFTLFNLFDWMGNPSEDELIQYLPPSIFEIDFKLTNGKGHSYFFNGLSSGEQQFVHTIQAIIYHLNNIQSGHANNEGIKYQAVNILLDEIELYFHPDFQRGFISKLLRAISRINPLEKQRIRTVNLLFLTHSPFILSDIPTENVLRLKLAKGKSLPYVPKDRGNHGEETFAANIYELLSNSFFIEGTAIGKFAEEKINAVIEKVNEKIPLSKEDHQLVDLIGDKFLRFSIEEFTNKKSVGR